MIWRQSPKVSGDGHFGHRIAFAPDGTIFLSSGDRQKFEPAQDLSGNLGKVLHLTDEGQPVPGNPWASRGGVAATFWTMGHRNVLGLAFAPDGRLWATRNGPAGRRRAEPDRAGQELRLAAAPTAAIMAAATSPTTIGRPRLRRAETVVEPVDLARRADHLLRRPVPAVEGRRDFRRAVGEALIRADIDGASARKADHWPMGARIREVDQGPRGEIYLLEDGQSGGRLLRLEPSR